MKIEKRGTSHATLVAGDRVTCSISHELKINGEASWVKFETNTQVQENETANDAVQRVITLTDNAVMSAAHTVVTTVNGVSKR